VIVVSDGRFVRQSRSGCRANRRCHPALAVL